MSVTAAQGFVASGVACGIKGAGALDLALVATDDARPVPAAAVFTSNRAAAAPVQLCRSHLATTWGRAAAVVLNSGCANAATGQAGWADAQHTCALVARGLACRSEEVLVCSTGLIGPRLPMEAMAAGIDPLLAARSIDGAETAALAILTTDTVPKEVILGGDGFLVGGMAKGAAMLAPDMATMLAVLTTDAAVESGHLQAMLREAVASSFNELLVDGATSTNDTVAVLASGRAGPVSLLQVADVLGLACRELAAQMASDAEGATRLATIVVRGAASPADARRAARAVAGSQLVQCSLHGADPYWGRVVSELGASGAEFVLDRVSVAYGGIVVCAGGIGIEHDSRSVAGHMAGRRIAIEADLGLGDHEASVTTTDLGPGYIEENMRTS